MPLITRHMESMFIAQLPGFPVCVGFIMFGSGSTNWKRNRYKSCELFPIWVSFYILNCVLRHKRLFQNYKKLIYCHVCSAACLSWIISKSFAKRMNLQTMKGASVFTITKRFCFQICFHPVASQLYFCCHFPQLHCCLTNEIYGLTLYCPARRKGMLRTARIHQGG